MCFKKFKEMLAKIGIFKSGSTSEKCSNCEDKPVAPKDVAASKKATAKARSKAKPKAKKKTVKKK